MKQIDLLAVILLSLANARCGGADCDQSPTGFELVVVAPNMDLDVQSISVLLAIEGEQWSRSFELEGTLADGETSLYVAVEPEPEVELDASLLVEGYDESGRMTARGSGRFVATPDACNRFRVTLEQKGKDKDDD